MAEIITEDAAKEKPSNPTPGNKTPETKKPTSDEIVKKIYRVAACPGGKYVGYIEGVLGSAIDKFYALPPEQRTYSAKMKVMQDYVGQINSLEAHSATEKLRQLLLSLPRSLRILMPIPRLSSQSEKHTITKKKALKKHIISISTANIKTAASFDTAVFLIKNDKYHSTCRFWSL